MPNREKRAWLGKVLLTFAQLSICLLFWHHQKSNMKLPITGDEPTYILMAKSFYEDSDVDIRNNYDNGQHLALGLPEQMTAYHGWWPYPKHPSFVASLFAPAVNVKGAKGLRRCSVFVSILTGLLLFWHIMSHYRINWVMGIAFLYLFFLTPPFHYMAGTFFMEAFGAFLVMCAWFLFCRPSVTSAFFLMFVLVLMPFVHWRFVALAVAFPLCCALSEDWRKIILSDLKKISGVLIALGLGGGCFWYYMEHNHGGYDTLRGLYGGHSVLDSPSQLIASLVRHVVDKQDGLFWHAPIYILGFSSLVLGALYRWKHPSSRAQLLIIGAGVFGMLSGFTGEAPSARLWTFATPLLAVSVFDLYVRSSKPFKCVIVLFAVPGVLFSFFFKSNPLLAIDSKGEFQMLHRLLGENLAKSLEVVVPTISPFAGSISLEGIAVLVAIVAFIFLVAVAWLRDPFERKTRITVS